MPGGYPPHKLASDLNERLAVPRHFPVSGNSAAISVGKATARPEAEARVSSGIHHLNLAFHPLNIARNTILAPKPGIDVVALVFLLLLLPQSVGCLVLASYILLGSFRSLSGKIIARYLVNFDNGIQFSMDDQSKSHISYYRSELLGEFLQLFSINSFILVVCHYTLPRAWFQYLIVMAKSIIASRLVGTHATGSTTYVSVLSNTANNAGSAATTTTTNNGQLSHLTGSAKTEVGSMPNSFTNFMTGFSFVIAANYVKDKASRHLDNLARLCLIFLCPTGDPKFFPLSLVASIDTPSFHKSIYYEDTKLFSAKASWASKLFFHLFVKFLHLGERSAQRLSFISKEAFIIIRFAYLVLCIHVISLTISPFLKRIFILKDYSQTLDHLSSLAPDVPYGGFKKGGMSSSAPRDSSSESVVVINMEQPRVQSSLDSIPYEIKMVPEMSKTPVKIAFQDNIMYTTAENFKIFCMKSSTVKSLIPGSKQSHARTIVDRKRSNITAAPSTTIMDKYFTISTQPIWTWLAAIKVLITKPLLFSGPPSLFDSKSLLPCSGSKLDLALVPVADSKIVFQLIDTTRLEALKQSLSVRVNDIPWIFVDVYRPELSTPDFDKVYISVYGLSPHRQFRIQFLENEALVGHHVVSTSSCGTSGFRETQDFSATALLHSSLFHSTSDLSGIKVGYKKLKKEESKRVTELKRQIDALKFKIEKYGVSQINEGRIGGKVKGLQNSTLHLENEIRELERQILDLESSNTAFGEGWQSEELKLNLEIAEFEAFIEDYEADTNKLKSIVKSVEGGRQAAEARLTKAEGRLKTKNEEIASMQAELKVLKRALTSKIHKWQRKIHDRTESIIPKIKEATDGLRKELWSFSYGSS